jgi:hypothetical protein
LQTLRLKYFVIAAVFGQDGDSPVLRLGVSRRNLKQKILWVLKRLARFLGQTVNRINSSSTEMLGITHSANLCALIFKKRAAQGRALPVLTLLLEERRDY